MVILKNLTRSSPQGINSLLKYILRQNKVLPALNVSVNSEKRKEWVNYVAGIELSKADKKYLISEKEDALQLKHQKQYGRGMTVVQYIQKYLLGKTEQSKEPQQKPLVITHNIKAVTIEGMAKEFKENAASRIRQSSRMTAIHHTILSFNRIDTSSVNDDMLKDVANKFIELRGTGNKYVITKHVDKDCAHLHIAISSNLGGRSSRLSKSDFANLKIQLDEYQRTRYGLVHSLPEHGKAKTLGRPSEKNKNDERLSKTALQIFIDKAFTAAISRKELVDEIEKQGHSVYLRNGRMQGVLLNGERKIRFSTLGFSKDKLATLDLKQKMVEKSLREMKSLRPTKGRDIEPRMEINRNVPGKEQNVIQSREQTLQELHEIRDRQSEDREQSNSQEYDCSMDNDATVPNEDHMVEDNTAAKTDEDIEVEDDDYENETTEID